MKVMIETEGHTGLCKIIQNTRFTKVLHFNLAKNLTKCSCKCHE
jgi:hypothetical protein